MWGEGVACRPQTGSNAQPQPAPPVNGAALAALMDLAAQFADGTAQPPSPAASPPPADPPVTSAHAHAPAGGEGGRGRGEWGDAGADGGRARAGGVGLGCDAAARCGSPPSLLPSWLSLLLALVTFVSGTLAWLRLATLARKRQPS